MHSDVEWWRPDSGQEDIRGSRANFMPVLETKDSPVAFRALMVFIFILLLSPQSIFPVLGSFRIAMLAAGLAIIAYISDRLKAGKPILIYTRETVIVICLVSWAILTIPLSSWPGGSVTFFFELYLKTIIIFFLLSNVINTLPRLHCMAWGLALMSVPLAVTGVKNYLLGIFLEGSSRADGYSGPLTANPNDLALMINLIIPVCIALFLGSRKPVMRMALAAVIIINVIAVFATFSRSGFVTLIVILAVYAWTLRRRPEIRWVYLALFLAVVVVPFAPSNYINRIITISNIEADETGSSRQRWADMVAATNYVLKHPITGAGVGMNILAIDNERGTYGAAVHNVYLQFAVELGLPGLILFLLLLKTSIKNVSIPQHYFHRRQEFSEFFYLAEGIRISLIAFAVAALFYPVAYHFYFYIFAGLAAATKSISEIREMSQGDNEIAYEGING